MFWRIKYYRRIKSKKSVSAALIIRRSSLAWGKERKKERKKERDTHRHHQFRLLPQRTPCSATSGATTAATDPAAPATPPPRTRHRCWACLRRDREACSSAHPWTCRPRRSRARRARRRQPCPSASHPSTSRPPPRLHPRRPSRHPQARHPRAVRARAGAPASARTCKSTTGGRAGGCRGLPLVPRRGRRAACWLGRGRVLVRAARGCGFG